MAFHQQQLGQKPITPFPITLRYLALTSLFILFASSASFSEPKLTARDVTVQLHRANANTPPDFSGKNLSRLDLSELNFSGVALTQSDLFGADLTKSIFENANLENARLDRSTIMSANFKNADLKGASILRPNIFSTLSTIQKEVATFEGANLSGAHLSGDLRRVSFRKANLTNAIFGAKDPRSEELITARVELRGCDFSAATLVRAILNNNEASYAKFTNANLRQAKLMSANLTMADFRGADLTLADFTGSRIEGAKFDGAIGLETAVGLP